MTPGDLAGEDHSGSVFCQLWPPDSRAISLQAVNFGMRTAMPSSPAQGTTWRRVISRCARIATTRKAHRVAALRVRK